MRSRLVLVADCVSVSGCDRRRRDKLSRGRIGFLLLCSAGVSQLVNSFASHLQTIPRTRVNQKTLCTIGASPLRNTALSLKTRQKTAVDPKNDSREISTLLSKHRATLTPRPNQPPHALDAPPSGNLALSRGAIRAEIRPGVCALLAQNGSTCTFLLSFILLPFYQLCSPVCWVPPMLLNL